MRTDIIHSMVIEPLFRANHSTGLLRLPSQSTNDQGGLNNRNVFLTVLEAGSSRRRCRQRWSLLGSLSLACRWPSSPCVLTWSSLCVCIPSTSFSSSKRVWKIFIKNLLLKLCLYECQLKAEELLGQMRCIVWWSPVSHDS